MSFFSNLFKAATPENAIMVREATPTPGVPSSTMPPEPQKPQGADYQERIAYTRSPQQALLVAVVYQAVRLRSDVMSVIPGIEGFDAIGPVIAVQQPAGRLAQRGMIAIHHLQLNDQRCFPGKQVQNLREQGDALPCSGQMIMRQVRSRQIFYTNLHSGHPLQRGIVDHSQIAVPHQMDVKLDPVASCQCRPEGGHRVFRFLRIVEAPVGIVPAAQLLKAGMSGPSLQTP